MLKRIKKHLLIALIATSVIGCDNGFNCPMDPPSCCFNLVFGCGLFDLPAGCSCSDFSSVLVAPAKLVSSKKLQTIGNTKLSKAPGITGNWDGDLGRVENSCSASLSQISGKITVTKASDKATIDVPSYGALRGLNRGALTTARGIYRQSGCQANVGASIRNLRAGRALAIVNTQLSCKSGLSCSAQFKGLIRKIR